LKWVSSVWTAFASGDEIITYFNSMWGSTNWFPTGKLTATPSYIIRLTTANNVPTDVSYAYWTYSSGESKIYPSWTMGGTIIWWKGIADVPTLGTTVKAYFDTKPSCPSTNPFWAYGYETAKAQYIPALVDILTLLNFGAIFKPVQSWFKDIIKYWYINSVNLR
jgi:hypothetical protein